MRDGQERQQQEEEADRTRIGTPTPHRKNPFKVSPMIQLKDKLYQKYGQMYDSFKGFDKNHSGLISCEQFANVVVKMNTGASMQTFTALWVGTRDDGCKATGPTFDPPNVTLQPWQDPDSYTHLCRHRPGDGAEHRQGGRH